MLFFSVSGCSDGPAEDDVYTAFISYSLAEPTTEEISFDDGSTTDGVILYNFDNVEEATYGITFNGLVRDTFTADSHTLWGMLTLTGSAVATLVLNYSYTNGVYTGTITGDTTAIDLSIQDFPAEE